MQIKFFCYEKDTGRIILVLPDKPSNNFLVDNNIIYNYRKYMSGIKWDRLDWEYMETPINLEIPFERYLYDPTTHEITIDENYNEVEL